MIFGAEIFTPGLLAARILMEMVANSNKTSEELLKNLHQSWKETQIMLRLMVQKSCTSWYA